jgi:hypothetical protein
METSGNTSGAIPCAMGWSAGGRMAVSGRIECIAMVRRISSSPASEGRASARPVLDGISPQIERAEARPSDGWIFQTHRA